MTIQYYFMRFSAGIILPTDFLIRGRFVMFWIKLTCKGICHRYKAPKRNGNSRYAIGQKRCNSCKIFVEFDGVFCPCCGMKMRVTPRKRELKEKIFNFSRI